MKRLPYPCLLSLAALSSLAALTGCGMASTSFGVVGDEPATTAISPPIQGSVFGGHAPLVGARVYVLSPSRTANYGLATSLMNTSLSTTAGASPVTPDVSGTGSASNGMYYVTTDGVGGFNLTGDYACTSGQPVYIAAVGGSPANILTPGNTYPISTIKVNSISSTSPVTESITATTSAPAGVYSVGEQVIFRQSSGTLAGLSGVSATLQGVTTSGGTTQLTFTAANVGGTAGTTYSFPAPLPTAVGISTNNTAVVNMAALGTCPSSGNFSSTGSTYTTTDTGIIPYIYMNEVSTVAAAYGFAAFGTDGFHIGANAGGPNGTYVANSLNQAIFNSFLLYDITGSFVNNTSQGEGHLARSYTPEQNGIVPQATLDTLGNILAACVDSGNTASTPNVKCTTLFNTATSNGTKYTVGGTNTGTPAADTSAAIFNIAHYPAGVGNTSFASSLYAIPGGTVPFTPALTTAPAEFSVTIAFAAPTKSPATGGTGSIINGPQVVAIDSAEPEGIWIGNYYTQPVKLFQSGTPDYATNAAMASFTHNQRSVSPDSSNSIWMTFGTANTLAQISSTGTVGTIYTGTGTDALNYPMSASIRYDLFGNEDLLVSGYYQPYIVKLSTSGTNLPPIGGGATTPYSSAACIGTPAGTNAVDPNGYVYSLHAGGSAGSGTMCVLDGTTGTQDFVASGFSTNVGPSYFSIGPAVNSPVPNTWAAWSGDALANRLVQYTFGSNSVSLALTGGGLNLPCSTAVDSAGTVWVGNGGNSSLSAFAYNSTTGAYYALSPAAGLAAQGGYSNCGNPAVDRAGDVWVAYQGNAAPTLATIYETIGIASPTVTPIATATKNGTLGTRPY